jgi:hypothetical protein
MVALGTRPRSLHLPLFLTKGGRLLATLQLLKVNAQFSQDSLSHLGQGAGNAMSPTGSVCPLRTEECEVTEGPCWYWTHSRAE